MKNVLCVVLMLISFSAFGQNLENIRQDSIFYEKIYKINTELDDLLFINFPQEDPKSRLESINNLNRNNLENYNEFLKTFPDSEYIFSALNGKAYTEFALKSYDTAKETYLKILEFISSNKGKTDRHFGLVFGEQNEKFIRGIYLRLASIELKNKNYQQALYYLDEAQKQPERIGCGNGFILDLLNIADMYSECYLNLKDDEKILDVLIPILTLLGDDQQRLSMLYQTLLKKYNKGELKKLFEESYEILYTKETIINNTSVTAQYVKFLNRDIIFYDFKFKNLSKQATKERLGKLLKESEFYTLLSK